MLIALLLGTAACRRKRGQPQAGANSEPAASDASSGSAPPAASHPGEAMEPSGLKLAFDQFQRKMQREPNDWQELIDAKLIPGVPKRKDGQPLVFAEFIEFTVHRGGQAGKR
jgi:hypothetical protein